MKKLTNYKLQITTNQGFTLIEMLVAITVLLLSITGPLTIAAQAVFSANIAKDRLTAAYLAQEGIELVRIIRDTNALEGAGWLDGLESCLGAECHVAPGGNTPTPSACSGGCPPLNINNDFKYQYQAGTPSIFTRTIYIDDLSSGGMEEVRVTSTVEWRAGGRTHEVVLTENLFNWR